MREGIIDPLVMIIVLAIAVSVTALSVGNVNSIGLFL